MPSRTTPPRALATSGADADTGRPDTRGGPMPDLLPVSAFATAPAPRHAVIRLRERLP